MKITINTFFILLFCYLGFVQSIVFFKVLWLILFALVVFIISLFVIGIVFYPEMIKVKFKESIEEKKCLITKNKFVSLIWGLISIGIQFFMIYPIYPVFASFYFVFSVFTSGLIFTIRKDMRV